MIFDINQLNESVICLIISLASKHLQQSYSILHHANVLDKQMFNISNVLLLGTIDQRWYDHMVADIEQVDTIIDKFLDYARPEHVQLLPLPLAELVQIAAMPFTVRDDMQVQIDVPPELRVLGDEVELSRVLGNLLENARRYGQTPGTGVTRVRIAATVRDQWVTLRVRDHGPGVAPDVLPSLTRPFFRGDSARTAATGAGLGLSIVAKMVQNMGGSLDLSNSPSGGLMAVIRLQQAPEQRGGSSLLTKRRTGGTS